LKLDKSIKFVLKDLIFNSDPDTTGDASDWNDPTIFIGMSYNSIIQNVNCDNGFGMFLRSVSNVNLKISDCSINYLRNQVTPQKLGYGICLTSDYSTQINNCSFSFVRHGITSNMMATTTNDTAYRWFGGSMYGQINNCRSYTPMQSGFDTHEDAYGYTFNNCYTNGGTRIGSAYAAGFTVRGRKTILNSCIAENCYRGFSINQSDADDDSSYIWNQSRDATILNNCRALEIREHALMLGNSYKIEGGEYRTYGSNGLVYVANAGYDTSCSGTMDMVKLICEYDIHKSGMSSNPCNVFDYGRFGNSYLTMRNTIIDISKAKSAYVRIVNDRGANNIIDGYNLSIYTDSTRLLNFSVSSNTAIDTFQTLKIVNVDTVNDIITFVRSHHITTGTKVSALLSGGGLVASRVYFVRVMGDSTVTLHRSPDAAGADTAKLDSIHATIVGKWLTIRNFKWNVANWWTNYPGIVASTTTTSAWLYNKKYYTSISDSSRWSYASDSTYPSKFMPNYIDTLTDSNTVATFKHINITDTTPATSSTTGAFQVDGGISADSASWFGAGVQVGTVGTLITDMHRRTDTVVIKFSATDSICLKAIVP
jgi:hypothetical protein